MAFSYDERPATGSEDKTYQYTFPVISTTHLRVFLSGQEVPQSDAPEGFEVQTGQIVLGSGVTVTAGDLVRVSRDTPDDPLISFQNGQVLTQAAMDKAVRQGLYKALEALDRAIDTIPIGGEAGEFLVKTSTDNYDLQWTDLLDVAVPADPQGGIITFDGGGDPLIVQPTAAGQFLRAPDAGETEAGWYSGGAMIVQPTDPVNGLGLPGDIWINSVTKFIWGPLVDATWDVDPIGTITLIDLNTGEGGGALETGAATDGDLFEWDPLVGLATPVEPIPSELSVSYLNAGQQLIAEGSVYKDYKTMAILVSTGTPGALDGWDDLLWYDKDTGDVWGPKGQDFAGQWPVSANTFFGGAGGLTNPLTVDLNLDGNKILVETGIEGLNFVKLGGVNSSNDAGLQIGVGLRDAGTPGHTILSPFAAGLVHHLRLGGSGVGGEVQDLSGNRYLTTADSVSFDGTMTTDLNMDGNQILSEAGIEGINFIKLGGVNSSNDAGLQVGIGLRDAGTPGHTILSPYAAGLVHHLRLGGSGVGGEVQDLSGNRYLTTADSVTFDGTLTANLDLNGFDIIDGAGETVLTLLKLNESSSDDVGFQMVMGDSDDPTTDYAALSPNSSTGEAQTRIGGQGDNAQRLHTPLVGGEVYEYKSGAWPMMVLKRHTDASAIPGDNTNPPRWVFTPQLNIGSLTVTGGDLSTYGTTVTINESGYYQVNMQMTADKDAGDANWRVGCSCTGGFTYGTTYHSGTMRANREVDMHGQWVVYGDAGDIINVYGSAFGGVPTYKAGEGILTVRRIA